MDFGHDLFVLDGLVYIYFIYITIKLIFAAFVLFFSCFYSFFGLQFKSLSLNCSHEAIFFSKYNSMPAVRYAGTI